MGLLDYTVLFNAFVWSLFFIPHAFMEDGNMGAMGFTPAAFMPRKYPLPPEINLLINHMVGIFGCAGIGMIATLLCTYFFCSESASKKSALFGSLTYQVLCLWMQFYKPSGTGVEGSPASGPIPVLIALCIPTLTGLLFG